MKIDCIDTQTTIMSVLAHFHSLISEGVCMNEIIKIASPHLLYHFIPQHLSDDRLALNAPCPECEVIYSLNVFLSAK